MTLFGITLATGLVVDDAIVVIENVERHITEGITEPHNAASVAMKEVAGAVIATSLVLVAVFVPGCSVPWHYRHFVPAFALTIAFSVSISAFNALTLTPALSAIFLGHHRERAQGAFFRAFNRGVEWVTEDYRNDSAARYRLAICRAVALRRSSRRDVLRFIRSFLAPSSLKMTRDSSCSSFKRRKEPR